MKMSKRILSIMLAIITLVSVVSVSAEALKIVVYEGNDEKYGYMAPVNYKGTEVLSTVKVYGSYDYINFYINSPESETTYYFYEIYSDKKLTKCVQSDAVEITDNANIVVEDIVEEETVFQVVEQQPEFPGGMKAMMKYLQENIQYPRISRDNNSQGRAFIRFVVNADGSIQGVEVLKSSGDIYLDKEAVRVVEGMPKWSPGKQAGKPVRVFFTLPVVFRLQ